jgi:hypothetical protein
MTLLRTVTALAAGTAIGAFIGVGFARSSFGSAEAAHEAERAAIGDGFARIESATEPSTAHHTIRFSLDPSVAPSPMDEAPVREETETPAEAIAAGEAHAEARREALDEILAGAPGSPEHEERARSDIAGAPAELLASATISSITCSTQLCRVVVRHQAPGVGHALRRNLFTAASLRGAGFTIETPRGDGSFETSMYAGQDGYDPPPPEMADGN